VHVPRVGADDTYTPVADARDMHALLPDATLRVIEGAAHLPNLERPREFNEALREFLARVDGDARPQEGGEPTRTATAPPRSFRAG
jgi:alpha-beta hydrolase superfamily lysophospholipase